MSKFTNNDVVVEAMQYPHLHNLPKTMELLSWLNKHGVDYRTDGGLVIETQSGEVRVMPGNWIIRSPTGRFSMCTEETFKETYEEVK